MRFFVRTGLATGVVIIVLAVAATLWAEYSARSSCARSTSQSKTAADGVYTALIERVLPEYHIGERHSIYIGAPPERVFDSLQSAGRYERPVVRLFGLLAVIAGNENAPVSSREKSIYEELRSGPDLVLEVPNREVVVADVGTADERSTSAPVTARKFIAYRLGRNEMKGAVNLRVDPAEGGTRLTTSTLMLYGDTASCRNFGRYWGVIYPGSSLLRIELLESIERRVESDGAPGSRNTASFGRGKLSEGYRIGSVPLPSARWGSTS